MRSLLHRQHLHGQNTVTPHITNIPHRGRQQQDDHHVFPNDLQTFINKMHFVRVHVAKREDLDGMRPSKGLRTTRTSRCDGPVFVYQYIRRFNFLGASRLTIFISRSEAADKKTRSIQWAGANLREPAGEMPPSINLSATRIANLRFNREQLERLIVYKHTSDGAFRERYIIRF